MMMDLDRIGKLEDATLANISSHFSSMMDLDRISKLPDAILADILSRLSMKEAVRSSVLSSSWQNLWKFYTGCCDFDDDMETKVLLSKGKKQFEIEQRRYIDWVNYVVASHQAPTIEQFRVSFEFGRDETIIIDRWMEFGAAKKVHRLELDLSSVLARDKVCKFNKDLEEMYDFPTRLLKLEDVGGGFKALTSLRLETVILGEADVLNFLSHCPLLEELSIADAPSLFNLRIVDGDVGLKLKHLEIRRCKWLENLVVSGARNLVSFKYEGKDEDCTSLVLGLPRMSITKMHFHDVPHLSSVFVGRGNYCKRMLGTLFTVFPFPVSQLKVLTLDLYQIVSRQQCMFLYDEYDEFAKLPNLHQLELSFWALDEPLNLFFAGSILRASPRLHKLVLKYQFESYDTERKKIYPRLWERAVEFGKKHRRLVEGCKYECLKEVELLGWDGRESDVRFVKHLIQAAVSLERITIDPCNPFCKDIWKRPSQPPPDPIAAEDEARNRARNLEPILSPLTKLVIL